MIKMLSFLICCLYLVMNTGQAGVIDNPVSPMCLSCICKVATTACVDVGCSVDRGGYACGYYQIRYEYYIDCYKPEPDSGCQGLTEEQCWMKCSRDKNCAERCIQAYMLRYRNKNGAGSDCESYTRLHAGGPFGAAKWSTYWYNRTTSYWNRARVYGCLSDS
ncbi:lysozyme-like [Mercenaria mercenaria]|uniref:lysozyme-like n=1 Tax=Mercenaria mercenaria TaxID=6596 RepID=UPI00234EC9ED|nr:lysozyme-like [Mercenaria mercenaria]